jgi:hypothetical protein
LSNVRQLRPADNTKYENTLSVAERATRLDPALMTLGGLLARKEALQQKNTGAMTPRERAWHTGELAAVRAMIDECLGPVEEEGT